MRSEAYDMSESIGNRSLYVLFLNTGIVKKIDKQILYTDVANITLEKLGIKHNAKFIMYNYSNDTIDNRVKFLEENSKKVKNFNQKTIMQD